MKLFSVIGDPIEHSLSPLMHNKWYNALQMPDHYHRFHLSKDQLEEGVRAMKLLGVSGFNVTIPHKKDIIPLLDDLNEEARQLGAVNTVVITNGLLKGFNTDGRGLVAAIQEKWPSAIKDARVLMVGAGGASLGVALTLAKAGVQCIDIANRTFSRAAQISEKCTRFTESKAFTLAQAEEDLSSYSVIINSTPMGMDPDWLNEIPLSLESLKTGTKAYCIDLIYNPLKTRWLREAAEKGAETMNGLPMLVHQGALSFEHWFGVKPETAPMITYLTQFLEEQHANR